MEYRYIETSMNSMGLHEGYDPAAMYNVAFDGEFIHVSLLDVCRHSFATSLELNDTHFIIVLIYTLQSCKLTSQHWLWFSLGSGSDVGLG